MSRTIEVPSYRIAYEMRKKELLEEKKKAEREAKPDQKASK
jgi:hypothetical protein